MEAPENVLKKQSPNLTASIKSLAVERSHALFTHKKNGTVFFSGAGIQYWP